VSFACAKPSRRCSKGAEWRVSRWRFAAALEELSAIVSLVPFTELALEAQKLALRYGTSFYDCLFLALAIGEEVVLALLTQDL
jgi:predicted nucleic acid-binding protein